MGMPCENGTAVVMKFDDISCLEQHLYSLSVELHSNLFELVPVQLIDFKSENEGLQRDRKTKLALQSDSETNKEDLKKDKQRLKHWLYDYTWCKMALVQVQIPR